MSDDDGEKPDTIGARIAVGAFGALSLFGAWIILRGNGFFHSPTRYASDAVFISGPPAMLVAALQLLAAALAFTWLARLFMPETRAGVLAFGLVFGPPLLYLLGR